MYQMQKILSIVDFIGFHTDDLQFYLCKELSLPEGRYIKFCMKLIKE